jgi:hypothetical protein
MEFSVDDVFKCSNHHFSLLDCLMEVDFSSAFVIESYGFIWIVLLGHENRCEVCSAAVDFIPLSKPEF